MKIQEYVDMKKWEYLFFITFLIKDSFLGEARFLLSSRLLLFYVCCSANEGYLSVVRGRCQTTPLLLPQPPLCRFTHNWALIELSFFASSWFNFCRAQGMRRAETSIITQYFGIYAMAESGLW